jgi:hypothetical protein
LYFEDMGNYTQVASGPQVRAVGWLAASQPYRSGVIDQPALEIIRQFAARWQQSVAALAWPVAAGFHTCELCGAARATGNFGVPGDSVLFVCPEMICHYISAHNYLPPAQFLDAIKIAPLPGTTEYAVAAAEFAVHAPRACDKRHVQLIQRTFSNPLIFQCPSCHEEALFVGDPAPPPLSAEDQALVRVAVAIPAGRLRLEVIRKLRAFVPELGAMSIRDAWNAVGDRSDWSLGVLPQFIAKQIVEEAHAFGLSAKTTAA